jgi:hypothetical protein
VHPRQPHAGSLGEAAEASSGGVPVHPRSSRVDQDRPGRPGLDGAVDRPADRRRKRHEHEFGALADDAGDAVAVFLAEVGDVGAGGLEDAQTEQAEHRHQAKSLMFDDSRAAASVASNWRWVSPSVGDSAGTVGRRTYSAGECERTPSLTQVR